MLRTSYFTQIPNPLCLPCHTTCLNCSGPNLHDCMTCALPYYFQSNGPSSCVTTCFEGYFSSANPPTCLPCQTDPSLSNYCTDCTGSLSYCIKCHTDMSDFYLYNNTCRPVCPDGFFGLSDGSIEKIKGNVCL